MTGENPLKSRDDLRRNLTDLLAPLKGRTVTGGYYLGDAGAHYSPRTALMEGWSRTLWGIGPLLAGGGNCPDMENVLSILRQGVDPASPGYWGEPGNRDQRLVEMAAIGLSLILARESFWDPLDRKEKEQLYNWLSFIERRELPPSNWHFFRILVCLAFRELGLPVNEKAERESLDLVEACYLGDGWFEDGKGGKFRPLQSLGLLFLRPSLREIRGTAGP
jgi:hypothetical protein